MGNPKQKWTEDEEEALLAGVAKHGPGKWKVIIKDPEFAPFLVHRSNVDLKDKWRNLGPSSGHGSKESTRDPKIVNTPSSASAPSVCDDASSDAATDDPSNSKIDGESAPRYNEMIFEALTTMKDANGSDMGAIVNFIKQRHDLDLPPNFRRLMSSRLRRLVLKGKLERVKNGYKIRKETPLGTKTPAPKQKDIQKDKRPRQLQNSELIASPKNLSDISDSAAYKLAKDLRDSSDSAAYKVADAENKTFLAAEAIKEAERMFKMAEDSELILQLAKEIHEKCNEKSICPNLILCPEFSISVS